MAIQGKKEVMIGQNDCKEQNTKYFSGRSMNSKQNRVFPRGLCYF